MAALAGLTGLIPITVAGGVALAFTKSAFPPEDRYNRSRRRSSTGRRNTLRYSRPRRRTTSIMSFGDFRNVGM